MRKRGKKSPRRTVKKCSRRKIQRYLSLLDINPARRLVQGNLHHIARDVDPIDEKPKGHIGDGRVGHEQHVGGPVGEVGRRAVEGEREGGARGEDRVAEIGHAAALVGGEVQVGESGIAGGGIDESGGESEGGRRSYDGVGCSRGGENGSEEENEGGSGRD